MRTRPTERRRLLAQVNGYAQRELDGLWLAATESGDFVNTLTDGYAAICDPYHELAGQMAAQWFEEADPASDYIAEVTDPLPEERMTGSVEWALAVGAGAGALALLSGSLQRSVFDGARDTTIRNVRDTGARWAVEADPGCCDYCQMIAARGAVYVSRDSAESAIQGFHDNCKCVAVEDR
jgi:hypothetical protein